MSDNIILERITFYKLDEDGDVLLDDKGNERIFTLKNFVDCSWICEGTDEEHLEEIEQIETPQLGRPAVTPQLMRSETKRSEER